MTLNEIILASLIYSGGILISLVIYFFIHKKFVSSSNKQNNKQLRSHLTNLDYESDWASKSIVKEIIPEYLKLEIEPRNSYTTTTQTDSTPIQNDIKRKPRYIIVNKQEIQDYKNVSNY